MMTFEEYQHLAENHPFPNRPSIFKIVAYSLDEDNVTKYVRNKLTVYNDLESYHTTFEEAESTLLRHAEELKGRMYCAYIYQLPLNKDTHWQYDRAWLYDHKGKQIDQSYCSETRDRKSKCRSFRGRPETAMRFKQGDIAEWFRNGKIEFVMIIHTPPTIQDGYCLFKEMNDTCQWIIAMILTMPLWSPAQSGIVILKH